MKLTQLLPVLALSLSSITADAAEFLQPSWRGGLQTEFAHWDRFTSASAPNAPDVHLDAPTLDARLTCTSPSAFVTSGGNLYSFNSGLSLQLDDSTTYGIKTVLLQVRTLGGALDLDSVRIVAPDAEGRPYLAYPRSKFTLSDEDLESGEQMGGQLQVQVFQFDFSNIPINGTYSILFRSRGSSMSLDQVLLDTSGLAQATATEEPLEMPKLELSRSSAGSLTLRYPQNSPPGTRVQVATGLGPKDLWQLLEIAPVAEGDDWLITVDPSHDQQYFRLQIPSR